MAAISNVKAEHIHYGAIRELALWKPSHGTRKFQTALQRRFAMRCLYLRLVDELAQQVSGKGRALLRAVVEVVVRVQLQRLL